MEKSWKRIIPMDDSDSSSTDDSQDHRLSAEWKHYLMSSKRLKMAHMDGQGTSTSPPGFSAVLVSAYPNPTDVLMHHDYVGTSRLSLNTNTATHDSSSQIRSVNNVPYLFYSKFEKLRDFYKGRHPSIYNDNNPPGNISSWYENDVDGNREHETSRDLTPTVLGDTFATPSTQNPAVVEDRFNDENQESHFENLESNREFCPVAATPLLERSESLPRESVLISSLKLEDQGSSSTSLGNTDISSPPAEQLGTSPKESKATNLILENGVSETNPNQEISSENKAVLSRDEKDGSLNEVLLGLLECPVCWEVMPPPIYQCQRGHLLCRPCRKRLSTCPTCRANLNSSRNLAMEKVAEKLKYPCKNSSSGCAVLVILRDKRDHEANCPHRLFTCLSPFCAPRWTCKLDTLILHYENMHSHMLRRGPKHILHIPVTHDFYRKLTSHVWIILAFEKLFMVNLRVVPPGEVFGCVQYVGPHSISRKFIYELKTKLPLDIYRCIRFERTTHSDQSNIDRLYLKKDCFYLSDNWTKNFKSDDIPRSMGYLEIFVCVRTV